MNWLFGKITDITDEMYNKVYLELCPERKAHIDRMKKENDRKRSLMATHLSNLLFEQYGKPHLKIENAPNSKPFVVGEDLYISISHSGEAVVCALSEQPIGIDIEKIKPVSQKLIDFVCTENEKEYVLFGGEKNVQYNFFSVWTAKEAYYKKSVEPIKHIMEIETLNINKQAFLIEDYFITII